MVGRKLNISGRWVRFKVVIVWQAGGQGGRFWFAAESQELMLSG